MSPAADCAESIEGACADRRRQIAIGPATDLHRVQIPHAQACGDRRSAVVQLACTLLLERRPVRATGHNQPRVGRDRMQCVHGRVDTLLLGDGPSPHVDVERCHRRHDVDCDPR